VIQQFATFARPVLDLPLVRRTRRNHGLEHATITMLSGRLSRVMLAGRSDSGGFFLFGDVSTDAVRTAVDDALRRMRNGERGLAIHPNCGTNLVTTSFVVSLAAMLGLTGASRKQWLGRLPTVMGLVSFGILLSQPLGLSLQRHVTTDGDPADLEVVSIARSEMTLPWNRTPTTVHRVSTRSR